MRREPTRFAAVITSGYVTEDLQQSARAAGVREVLLEEYTLERLAGLVDRILAGSD